MKPNTMVYAILVFGLIMSAIMPHLINMAFRPETVYENKEVAKATNTSIDTTLSSGDIVETASEVDLAFVTPAELEVAPEPKEAPQPTPEPQPQPQPQPQQPVVTTVYDGLTMDELVAKLNKNLKSNLAGTGNIFAKYSLEYGVDPYLATAIVLHETGCKWRCSSAVKKHNNVGGMYSGGKLIHFNSLEEGIKSFISNLKTNYYDKGLTTPEQINKKYAASKTWATKINHYMNIIKNS